MSADSNIHFPAAHRISRIIGHSKGSLAIANALRSLPPERTRGISVVTFGCAIAEELAHCAGNLRGCEVRPANREQQ